MAIAERKVDGATVYEVTLTTLMINSRTITLPKAPKAPEKVTLDVIGGSAQSLNTDFVVSAASIQWTAMGLETVLSVNDKVRIIFHD